MIVETEPNGMLMVRYKLYFNQQRVDPEDAWVLDYLEKNGLVPRRELQETREGVSYKLLHYGQCYLARHLGEIRALYQKGVEHSALGQRILELCDDSTDAAVEQAAAQLEDEATYEVAIELAAQLYDQAKFETSEDGQQLAVQIDEAVATQAFVAACAARHAAA